MKRTHARRAPGVGSSREPALTFPQGSSRREEGELTAAFAGSHGWFWRNRTGEPVTITLQTTGAYAEVKRMV